MSSGDVVRSDSRTSLSLRMAARLGEGGGNGDNVEEEGEEENQGCLAFNQFMWCSILYYLYSIDSFYIYIKF